MKKKEYSRRNFIKQNSLAGLGIISMGGIIAGSVVSETASANPMRVNPGPDIRTISDLNLKQIRTKYKEVLFNQFLPNMDKYVIDHEFGGFMCSVNQLTGKLESTNKRAWFEGRGMWTYSFLYNNFEKNPHYLEVARKSKDFILPLLPSDDSFYISGFTKEGKPLSNVEGDIYGNLFVAEGLAEFSKASGEKQYLELAKKITLSALGRYDRLDYRYPITYGPPGAPEIPAPRVNGHWMIFLSVATQMLRHGPDVKIKALADRCVDAIMKHHLNAEYKLINEGNNHDLTLPDNEWAQFSYLGHSCENLAFVMNYAVLIKDAQLFKDSSAAFKRHVTVAKDSVYGGYFSGLDQVDKYIFKLNKACWVMEEILNGSLILIEHTGDQWALNCFAETNAYVREKFIRPESEYVFMVRSGDRKVVNHSTVGADLYHHPRQHMVTLLAIERMIKRGEKPSGIFS